MFQVFITLCVLVATVIAGIYGIFSEKIGAGYEGILVSMYGDDKGVNEITLVTGRAWYNPTKYDVIVYPTTFKTVDYEPFKIPSKDGTQFIADPSIEAAISPGKTPLIYKNYRKNADEFFNSVVYNRVRNAFRDVVSTKTTDELIKNRAAIESEVGKYLQESLANEGVVVKELTANLVANEQLQAQFDQRAIATQQQQTQETVNQTLIKTAKSKSEAKIIEAEAEARANELKQKTLTPELVQQQFIEKWDGKLPVYGTVPALIQQVTR